MYALTKQTKHVKGYVPKNTSILSLSGLKLFLFLVDILPAVLNNRSEAELEAQMDRYFLANCDNMGKEKWFVFFFPPLQWFTLWVWFGNCHVTV